MMADFLALCVGFAAWTYGLDYLVERFWARQMRDAWWRE